MPYSYKDRIALASQWGETKTDEAKHVPGLGADCFNVVGPGQIIRYPETEVLKVFDPFQLFAIQTNFQIQPM